MVEDLQKKVSFIHKRPSSSASIVPHWRIWRGPVFLRGVLLWTADGSVLKQTQTQTFAFCRLNFQHLVLQPLPRKTTAGYYKNRDVIHNRVEFPLGAAQTDFRKAANRYLFLFSPSEGHLPFYFLFLIVKDISDKCQVQQDLRGAALIRRSR